MNDANKILKEVQEASAFLKSKVKDFPKFCVVLGSGLSGLLDALEVKISIPYSEIPHMKVSAVEGHHNRLLIGNLKGVDIACMQGRLHFYEGLSMAEVVHPFRSIAFSGAEVFLLTNAAGGLHPDMAPMDFLVVEDHINLMGTNPLIGKNIDALGPRFPDMTYAYDKKIVNKIWELSKVHQVPMRKGVYVGIHGPSYETPTEIKMYRKLGADVVGMSTVPEAIALRHMGKRIAAISCITNLAAGVNDGPLVHSEVLENAKKAHPGITKLVVDLFLSLRSEYV